MFGAAESAWCYGTHRMPAFPSEMYADSRVPAVDKYALGWSKSKQGKKRKGLRIFFLCFTCRPCEEQRVCTNSESFLHLL